MQNVFSCEFFSFVADVVLFCLSFVIFRMYFAVLSALL